LSGNDKGHPVWGKATREQDNVLLSKMETKEDVMPDVIGMGAKDAVFMLENLGVKVRVNGRGHVCKQSIQQGRELKPGMTCDLQLQ
jgi:cell division protein FtsI (penicillin-binding protein 3)